MFQCYSLGNVPDESGLLKILHTDAASSEAHLTRTRVGRPLGPSLFFLKPF